MLYFVDGSDVDYVTVVGVVVHSDDCDAERTDAIPYVTYPWP